MRRTEKMNVEDELEKDNCSSLKRSVVERTKSTGGQKKSGYIEKEMS